MSVATGKNDFEAGLTFEIDASNPRSYSGSGTSIYDLSGNNVTGTLTNGPTYSSLHGGTITFDGTNDLISFSPTLLDNITEGTISAWVYLNSITGAAITARQRDGVNTYAVFSIGSYSASGGSATAGTAGKLYWHGKNGVTEAASTNNITASRWHHVVVTFSASQASFYINGVFDSTTAGDYVAGNSGGVLSPNYTQIGCWNNNGGKSIPLNGNIANLSVYSRALGASEVAQIFDSTKGQFVTAPTTNGLILYLDAGNTSSYSGSGTAWTDISGYGNNGTLTNGPTYSALNGGYFTFDRADDYCIVPFSTILNNCTISVWFKATSTASYQYLLSLGNGSNTSFAFHFDMNDPDLGATGQTMWVYWNSGGTPYSALSRSGTYGDYNDNTWRNYCFVRNNSDASVTKHYMNGSERTTGVTRAGTQTTQFGNGAGYNINIGRFHTGGNFFAGNVAIFQVYNRVLTDTEISQNFNAFRERFNI